MIQVVYLSCKGISAAVNLLTDKASGLFPITENIFYIKKNRPERAVFFKGCSLLIHTAFIPHCVSMHACGYGIPALTQGYSSVRY